MKNKRLIALITILCLSSPISVLADVNEDVKNAQEKYQEYQAKVDDVTGKVIKLNGVIEEHLSSIEENNGKIVDLNNEIKTSESLIEDLKKDIKDREKIKKKRVREFYKSGGSLSYVGVLLDFDDFWDFLVKLENTNRLISIDKNVISGIEEDRKKVKDKIEGIESNKSSIVELNNKVKEDTRLLEINKKEQEGLLNKVKEEQDKFGKDVLEVAERELIKPQVDVINSSDDIGSLSSAVSQLNAVNNNQLQTDVVKSEVNSLISTANEKIESLRPKYNATISDISRGSVGSTGNAIVDYAYQFLGRNYVWGAVGPDVFDCSGLTSYVYRNAANLEISRTTYTQINIGKEVSQNELQPGDLVFTYNNEHVGIYVGGGQYINATYPGSTVRVTPITNFYAARRIL